MLFEVLPRFARLNMNFFFFTGLGGGDGDSDIVSSAGFLLEVEGGGGRW